MRANLVLALLSLCTCASSTRVIRRRLFVLAAASTAAGSRAAHGSLGYIDNAGAKSYSQVQRAWEKSEGMSQREIMMAARGAPSLTPEEASKETEKGRKRRAMAGCKDEICRREAGYENEASCNSRVLGGDPQFMLDVLDAQ